MKTFKGKLSELLDTLRKEEGDKFLDEQEHNLSKNFMIYDVRAEKIMSFKRACEILVPALLEAVEQRNDCMDMIEQIFNPEKEKEFNNSQLLEIIGGKNDT